MAPPSPRQATVNTKEPESKLGKLVANDVGDVRPGTGVNEDEDASSESVSSEFWRKPFRKYAEPSQSEFKSPGGRPPTGPRPEDFDGNVVALYRAMRRNQYILGDDINCWEEWTEALTAVLWNSELLHLLRVPEADDYNPQVCAPPPASPPQTAPCAPTPP